MCIDTGSADFWLPNYLCSDRACLSHQRYDPQASTTATDVSRLLGQQCQKLRSSSCTEYLNFSTAMSLIYFQVSQLPLLAAYCALYLSSSRQPLHLCEGSCFLVQHDYTVVQLLYGRGLAYGTSVFDTVSIGDPAVITPRQGVGAMDKVSSNFANVSCDGFYVSCPCMETSSDQRVPAQSSTIAACTELNYCHLHLQVPAA